VRVGSVTIGRPGEAGREYSGLNFSFRVRKTLTPEMNPGTVVLYNLSADTRRSIHELETVCILRAGYSEVDGAVELFRGYVSTVSTSQEGPNITTTLELRDGYQELRAAQFSKSYVKGTSVRTALNDIVESLGLPPDLKSRIDQLGEETLARSWSYNGPAKDALSDVARLIGVDWSVQSGKLKLIKKDEIDRALSWMLSPTTGLIGRPTRISDIETEETKLDTDNTKLMGWRTTSILLPTVEPGNSVRVQSDELTGDFKVINVEHEGELMGQSFTTTLEVIEL
jgi:hypothetical protein